MSLSALLPCAVQAGLTRSFPCADVGSDDDMTFQTRLKKSRKPTQPRIRFDLEKMVMNAFQANIRGGFAPLTMRIRDDDVIEFNKVVTDTATKLLGKHTWRKSPRLLTKSIIAVTKGET